MGEVRVDLGLLWVRAKDLRSGLVVWNGFREETLVGVGQDAQRDSILLSFEGAPRPIHYNPEAFVSVIPPDDFPQPPTRISKEVAEDEVGFREFLRREWERLKEMDQQGANLYEGEIQWVYAFLEDLHEGGFSEEYLGIFLHLLRDFESTRHSEKPSGGTLEDYRGLLAVVDACRVPVGATVWDGARTRVLECVRGDRNSVRMEFDDGTKVEYAGKTPVHVLLHGALETPAP